MNYRLMDTPIGRLRLAASNGRLVAVEFEGHYDTAERADAEDAVLAEAARQLEEYFAGRRRTFDLPLGARGTDFQRQVWASLQQIPYGEVRSYRDIARAIAREKAVRAVGAANGRNPLPIVVPCHRVIGSDGRLTGFAGGLAAKRTLLQLEGALPG